MCRRNQHFACIVLAFGLGVILGGCLEEGLVRICCGFGCVILGLYLLQKK